MTSESSDNNVVRFANSRRENAPLSSRASGTPKQTEDICQYCFGTGTWLNDDKGAMLCPCRHSDPTKRIRAALIPERFAKSSLHNYYPKNDSQFKAHSYASTLIKDYPGVEKGLLMMGDIGVGKTHLAAAILNELVEKKGVSGLFYESGFLLKTIQESYNSISQTSEMRVLAPVLETEVLVLDELGATSSSDWVKETLYQIINTRYNHRKLSIFTTNFVDERQVEAGIERLKEQIAELAKGGFNAQKAMEEKALNRRLQALMSKERLEDRIGFRLRSRLNEMCQRVWIGGQDYRQSFVTPEVFQS
jgi:DNA replication protein DnaC